MLKAGTVAPFGTIFQHITQDLVQSQQSICRSVKLDELFLGILRLKYRNTSGPCTILGTLEDCGISSTNSRIANILRSFWGTCFLAFLLSTLHFCSIWSCSWHLTPQTISALDAATYLPQKGTRQRSSTKSNQENTETTERSGPCPIGQSLSETSINLHIFERTVASSRVPPPVLISY